MAETRTDAVVPSLAARTAQREALPQAICGAIDAFHLTHPDLAVSIILQSLESVRHPRSVEQLRMRAAERGTRVVR